MVERNRSEAYYEHLTAGPFPGHTDPFAEAGRFFHQLHMALLHAIIEDIHHELFASGYYLGGARTLQASDRRYPEPECLEIFALGSGDLVTVLEIVSPGGKTTTQDIAAYRQRRQQRLQQGVNVVEIDITRSERRLHEDDRVAETAYHLAIHRPEQGTQVVGVAYGQPLPIVELPLHDIALPSKTGAAYRRAYRSRVLAVQVQARDGYRLSELPFPSLLSDEQKQGALAATEEWKRELARLAAE
jgi:hypothetical protein